MLRSPLQPWPSFNCLTLPVGGVISRDFFFAVQPHVKNGNWVRALIYANDVRENVNTGSAGHLLQLQEQMSNILLCRDPQVGEVSRTLQKK